MPSTDKLDLYKLHKDQYAAGKKPRRVTIAPAQYLAIAGKGRPGDDAFQAHIAAIYGVVWTIKMTSKIDDGRDYKICPLEGIWWARRRSIDLFAQSGEPLNWKLLVRTPEFIEDAQLATAAERLIEKGKGPEVRRVKLETIEEGPCVQMLHVGPYDAEPATIALMRDFAKQQGVKFHGRHHEIYLSDPRRVPPERLRTILRQPVK